MATMYTFDDDSLWRIKNLIDNERVYVEAVPKVTFKFKRMGDDMFIFYYPDDKDAKIDMRIEFEDDAIYIEPTSVSSNKYRLANQFTDEFVDWPWGKFIKRISGTITE